MKVFSMLRVMVYHPANDIWLYLLAAGMLLALAVYAWRYRQAPPALYLSLGVGARALWLVSLVMITVSPALTDKNLWAVIQQLSSISALPIALLVALHLTGQKTALIRAVRTGLLAAAALMALMLLTNGWHHLYWRGVVWDGTTYGFIRGPVYWAGMVIAYASFALTLTLYARLAAGASGLRRWQALAVPADMMISVAGHAYWLTNPQAGPVPVLPVAFMLGSLVWFAIFYGLRVFNLLELAEATVTRDMKDCLIVTDSQNYLVELNPAAEELCGARAAALVGSRAETAFARWPDMAALVEGSAARWGEIAVAGGHYLFRVSLLTGWRGRSIGKAIVLQDIGELKQAQARIIEQAKALSIMAERERLGRELHDGPGQVWNYLGLKLQTVEAFLAADRPDQAQLEVRRLLGTVREQNAAARESIVGLKLAADTGDDFTTKLKDYLAWYRESNGIEVELNLTDGPAGDLAGLREVQLLRIIQEALTNIRKHAGASRVKVSIAADGGRMLVRVEDDGRGFDVAAIADVKTTFGLKIMAERAEEAGGQLEIESRIGAGTKVTVRFDPENEESKVKNDADIARR